MEKITIIVPFYGVEKYIEQCLQSLINQTYKNIEILCVDDCSPDNSLAIVEAYAEEDPRIKILSHKSNKGLGGARNTGIRHACGEFICFVDSDDYVSKDFAQQLINGISESKSNSDIVVCNFLQDQNGEISDYGGSYMHADYPCTANKDHTLEVAMKFNPGCTNKMYRRHLLVDNNICFPEHQYYEDVIFWVMAVFYADGLCSIPGRLYCYRQRAGSIMATLTEKHIDHRFVFIRQIDAFIKAKVLTSNESNASKVNNDLLTYILRHLSYGKMLIDEGESVSKAVLESYYMAKVADFSRDYAWPGLMISYNLYQQNKSLSTRLKAAAAQLLDIDAVAQKTSDDRESNSVVKHKRVNYFYGSVCINIIMLAIIFTAF